MSWEKISIHDAEQHKLWNSWCALRVFMVILVISNIIMIPVVAGLNTFNLIMNVIGCFIIFLIYQFRSSKTIWALLGYIWGNFIIQIIHSIYFFNTALIYTQDSMLEYIVLMGSSKFILLTFISIVLMVYIWLSKTYRLQYKLEIKK